MHDTLSHVTKPTMQPKGRSAFHVARRGQRDANGPEPLCRERTECSPSFLAAIARELSMVHSGSTAEYLYAARRLLNEAFDAMEASVLSPNQASPVLCTLARVQAGAWAKEPSLEIRR